MTDAAHFWDRIADKYAARPVADEAAYERKLAMTRKHLRPDMDVLEIGCGTGSTAILHAPHVRHVRATDLSPRMVAIAEGKVADAGLSNVTCEVGTLESLSAPEDAADMILTLSLLHLLDDLDAALARIHALLRPGGMFVSSTACIAERMSWFKFIAPIGRKLGLIPPVHIFRAEHLRKAMRKAGFEIIEDWLPDRGMTLFIVARKI